MAEPTRDAVRTAIDSVAGDGAIAVWIIANRCGCSLADARSTIARMIADDQLIDCVAVPWWNR